MTRRFLCTGEDLKQFEEGIVRLQGMMCFAGKDLFLYLIDKFHTEMKLYDLQPDILTDEFIATALKQRDVLALHNAVHNMVWQMWDAHNRSEIKLPIERFNTFNRVTLKCLAEAEVAQAS